MKKLVTTVLVGAVLAYTSVFAVEQKIQAGTQPAAAQTEIKAEFPPVPLLSETQSVLTKFVKPENEILRVDSVLSWYQGPAYNGQNVMGYFYMTQVTTKQGTFAVGSDPINDVTVTPGWLTFLKAAGVDVHLYLGNKAPNLPPAEMLKQIEQK
jgi:dihydropteroate synthase